jgi:hypothetical protein
MKLLLRWIAIWLIMSLVACQPNVPMPTPPATEANLPPPKVATTEVEGDTPVATVAPTLLGVAWDDRSPFRKGLIASEQVVLSQLEGASIYHLDLVITDDLLCLNGEQEVRYTNQEAEPLNEVYFRLFPNLFGGSTQIDAVEVREQAVRPTFELDDSTMRVPLLPELQPGERVVVKISFSVLVPTEAVGNYGVFGFVDDILALAHFYPLIAVYDDEGWNLEIPPSHGDVVYADSSFYLVRVTAPATLVIVASGVEIGRQGTGDRQQITFAGGPMRDFYLAASAQYSLVREQVGQTIVNSYAPYDLFEQAQSTLDYAAKSLQLFSDWFGVYPFTEFDVVSTPTLALGIEYPGMTAIALRLYDPDQSLYPSVYLESTVAHEVAHQWFYSTVGNDQLDEPWLDEALAQYATLLYWQDLYGPAGAEGFRSSLEQRWARVNNADIPIGMPASAYSGTEYGAIVYGRGPLFIEAMAETMGAETFKAFLRDYYETYMWGIATANGLKVLAESHCDCDLTRLFTDWVYER